MCSSIVAILRNAFFFFVESDQKASLYESMWKAVEGMSCYPGGLGDSAGCGLQVQAGAWKPEQTGGIGGGAKAH